MSLIEFSGNYTLLFLPAIPVAVWWIGGVLITAIVSIIVVSRLTRLKGNSIAILGPQGCGKTSLYRILQNRRYDRVKDGGTSVEEYNSFKSNIVNKNVHIEGGKDIGGSRDYVPTYYKQMINEKDIIIFLFDINEYLSDVDYANDVHDRLDFIWPKLKAKYGSDDVKSKYALIGTHYDLVPKEKSKKAYEELSHRFNREEFVGMLKNNTILADLTKPDNKELSKCLEKLFG